MEAIISLPKSRGEKNQPLTISPPKNPGEKSNGAGSKACPVCENNSKVL